MGTGIDILTDALNNGTLTFEALEALTERAEEMKKRKESLSLHKTPIKQLPSGRWYTRIDGKKIEKKDRKAVEDAVIASLKTKELTLVSIFDEYMDIRKHEVSPRTWTKDLYYYEAYFVGSELGKKPISELTLKDGFDWADHCKSVYPEMKRRYWTNLRGTLRGLIEHSIKNGYITDDPFRYLKLKKEFFVPKTATREEDTVFSTEEQHLVCIIAKEDSDNTRTAEPLGILILFLVGIRDGELCGLKWGDISEDRFGRKTLHIQRQVVDNYDSNGKRSGFTLVEHPKTSAGDRRLQLSENALSVFRAVKSLNEARGISTEDDDFIFVRILKGEHLMCTPRSFDPRLRRYCKLAGMEVIKSPHDARRTALTRLYTSGMPLKKIQAYAGHSSLQQTLDYLRITDDDIDLSSYLDSMSPGPSGNIVSFGNTGKDRIAR